jgi:hypothetical protein
MGRGRGTGHAVRCSAAALLLLAAGCGRATTAPAGAPSDLTGTWTWVESVARSAVPDTISPASVGFTARLVLTRAAGSDGLDGDYQYLKNGELVSSGRYGVSCHDACGNESVLWQPAFEHAAALQWVTRWNGSMRLADAVVGGYVWLWRRAE